MGAGNPDLPSTLESSRESPLAESLGFLSIDLGCGVLSIDLGLAGPEGLGVGLSFEVLHLESLELGVVSLGVGELAAEVGREDVPEGRKLVVLRGIEGSSL